MPMIWRTSRLESGALLDYFLQPYPVYVEKSLSKSEQFKLSAFWYLVGVALVAVAYIFRKPFLKLIRKIIG